MATLTNREPSELVVKRIFYALQVRTRTILNITVDREFFVIKKFSSMTFSDGFYGKSTKQCLITLNPSNNTHKLDI